MTSSSSFLLFTLFSFFVTCSLSFDVSKLGVKGNNGNVGSPLPPSQAFSVFPHAFSSKGVHSGPNGLHVQYEMFYLDSTGQFLLNSISTEGPNSYSYFYDAKAQCELTYFPNSTRGPFTQCKNFMNRSNLNRPCYVTDMMAVIRQAFFSLNVNSTGTCSNGGSGYSFSFQNQPVNWPYTLYICVTGSSTNMTLTSLAWPVPGGFSVFSPYSMDVTPPNRSVFAQGSKYCMAP